MWKDIDLCLFLEVWVINMEGNLIGNKIADKIKSVSKTKPNYNNDDDDAELATHKIDIYHQKKDNKLLMN